MACSHSYIGAAKGRRSLASSDKTALSFQTCTYTPSSNNLKKKKKRSLCTWEWHFTRCSLQTIQHTDSGCTSIPQVFVQVTSKMSPGLSAPRLCQSSSHCTASSPSKGEAWQAGWAKPLGCLFSFTASRSYKLGHILKKILQFLIISRLSAVVSALHLPVLWLLGAFKYSIMLFPSQ